MKIEAVNIAKAEEIVLKTRTITSAIRKKPTLDTVEVDFDGIVGDEIGDKKHHGGPNRALHCFSAEYYDCFELCDCRPRPWVGENLTTRGYTDNMVAIGDRLKIGTTILEVSMPTERCSIPEQTSKVPTLTKWMIKNRRTGFYLRVIEPGKLCVTDTIEVIEAGDLSWPIQFLTSVMYEKVADPKWIEDVLKIPKLAQEWKDSVLKMHEKKK
jgi:MOSC domain-containing protein YiiM